MGRIHEFQEINHENHLDCLVYQITHISDAEIHTYGMCT